MTIDLFWNQIKIRCFTVNILSYLINLLFGRTSLNYYEEYGRVTHPNIDIALTSDSCNFQHFCETLSILLEKSLLYYYYLMSKCIFLEKGWWHKAYEESTDDPKHSLRDKYTKLVRTNLPLSQNRCYLYDHSHFLSFSWRFEPYSL